MEKKKRRYVAAALAIAGVAGLSMAAAAQLTVRTAPEIAIGSGTFTACDPDGVDVSYTYEKTDDGFVIGTVTVGDIATACQGQPISVFVTGVDSETNPLIAVSGTVTDNKFTEDVTANGILIKQDLREATVIIGGATLP